MKLLLLLSALLSALTGVTGGTRAPQTIVAVSRVAETVAARVVIVVASGRPAFAPPMLSVMAGASAERVWTIAAAVPLFASRRRE